MSLDILKGIAAIGIIFIHFSFPSDFGIIIQVIARFGVPIFFMCSGYYLHIKNLTRKGLKHKERHIWGLLLLGILLYLKFNIINWGLDKIITEFTFSNLLKFLVFNAPQISTPHLWFLSALLYSYVLVYCIYVFGLEKHHKIIIVVLLSAHVTLSEIITLIGIELPHPFVRNAYFYGVSFLMIGCWISDHRVDIERMQDKKIFYAIIIGFIIAIVERYVLPTDDLLELYMGVIVACIGLFILCVKHPGVNIRPFNYIGSSCSMGMYIFHPIVGDIVDKVKLPDQVIYEYIRPIIIAMISIFVGMTVNQLQKQSGQKLKIMIANFVYKS